MQGHTILRGYIEPSRYLYSKLRFFGIYLSKTFVLLVTHIMSNQKVFATKTLTNHDDCKEKIVQKNSLIRFAEEYLTIY